MRSFCATLYIYKHEWDILFIQSVDFVFAYWLLIFIDYYYWLTGHAGASWLLSEIENLVEAIKISTSSCCCVCIADPWNDTAPHRGSTVQMLETTSIYHGDYHVLGYDTVWQ
jgi:hypothetical protein